VRVFPLWFLCPRVVQWQVPDGGKECVINDASVKEKRSENLENALFVSSIEGGDIVGKKGKWDFGSVIRLLPRIWGMLWFDGRGIESAERMLNISGHGHVPSLCIVIPLEGRAGRSIRSPSNWWC
jgi:hypothetical protein